LEKILLDKIKYVLIHNVGDNRRCPKCNHSFIPDDPTSRESLELFKELKEIEWDQEEEQDE
jgi:hypothetical protein